MQKILPALAILLFLGGCATVSRLSVISPTLANIPASLKVRCQNASDLPERALDVQDVARLWAKDRSALSECRARHKALTGAVSALGEQFKD